MSYRSIKMLATAMSFALPLAGCVTGGAIQPDRSVFSLDGNYQRYQYDFGIEETFDRTVKVFKDAGYRLDVVDKATGQISGERGMTTTRAGTAATDKGLKFYGLVLPTPSGQSQVAIKIVQVIKRGSMVNSTKTEIIVGDAQMYQFMFRRIADMAMSTATPDAQVQNMSPKAPIRGASGTQPYQ
jgi:hypothetical protein